MGRPLNKRFFGADTNDNIRVRFHNGTSSVDGAIVKQKGSKKFLCVDASGNQATCTLASVADGSLAAGEMSIKVKNDTGTVVYVTKITRHKVTGSDGATYPWNFDTSTSDSAVQIEESGTDSTFSGNVDLS
jgi:hypothetical protein